MPRPRTIPDADVFRAVRRLLAEGGDKAVAFASVARATGLAAPSLVQRYGSRDGMLMAALENRWDALDRQMAEAETLATGAAAFLKALVSEPEQGGLASLAADFRNPVLRARAEAWRERVEAALTQMLGGGAKAREGAALLFAVWQGQALWHGAGGRAMRLKDVIKRIG